MKRALERTARCVLHHPTRKEAKHHPGYNLAFIAREEQLPIPSRCENPLKLLFSSNRQEPATCPVNVNCVIGRYVITALGKVDRNPAFYPPPDIVSPGLRKLAKEGIWTHCQVQHDDAAERSLTKAGVDQSGHIGPEKKIDKLRGSRFLKKTGNQIAHCTQSVGVSRKGNLRAAREPRLNSVSVVKPGHDRRDILVDDTKDGERLLAGEHGLAKVLGRGVMSREFRIG